MNQRIVLFALIALISAPAFGQIGFRAAASPGVGLTTLSLEDNGYFKPKKKKKKKKKEDADDDKLPLKDRLWYGASGVLGGGSANGESSFSVGIQPMVGYKLTPWLSVGPRLGLIYQLQKVRYTQTITQTGNGFLTTAGVFARARFWSLFLHGEVNQEWVRVTYKNNVGSPKFTEKTKYGNQLVGLGYNEGRERELGYELLLLLNIKNANDPDYPYVPIEFRGGLTYNF